MKWEEKESTLQITDKEIKQLRNISGCSLTGRNTKEGVIE